MWKNQKGLTYKNGGSRYMSFYSLPFFSIIIFLKIYIHHMPYNFMIIIMFITWLSSQILRW